MSDSLGNSKTLKLGNSLFAFTLGREWKLSLAELIAIFGRESYCEHAETIAIFEIRGWSDEQIVKRFLTIGGTIRVMKVISDTDMKRFPTDVITLIKGKNNTEGKNTFALGSYGIEFPVSNIGLRIKKTLQEDGLSVRLVNTENKNIVSAVFKRERLAKSQTEYNLLVLTPTSEKDAVAKPIARDVTIFLAVTLACQDIDAYTRRDTGKSRDMVVGMMPPKLVQMMLNIATQQSNQESVISDQNGTKKNNTLLSDNCKLQTANSTALRAVYDPFCGLGTTLIEAANMGITRIYGSDLSPEMVAASKQSLAAFIKEEMIWQERILAVGGTPNKDLSKFESDIFQLDAKKVKDAPMFQSNSNLPAPYRHSTNLSIISEGYLGEMMSPRDITLDRVQSERRKLASLYADFFSGLTLAKFRGNIVMSFPFWNIHGVYSYFIEIYDVLEKNGFEVIDLLPGDMHLNTRKGSLLYRRENQTVGREIVKIVRR